MPEWTLFKFELELPEYELFKPYMIQPLVKLYGGCIVVLKVS